MTYRQSGIEYREANFAYNTSDATVSVDTISATANLVLTASYTYRPSERPGFVDYRNRFAYNELGFEYNERDNTKPDNRLLKIYNQPNVAYRQASSVGISFVTIAFPGSIPIVATVGGTGSIPVTIVAATIGCTSEVASHTGPLIINLDMNYIEIAGHISTVVKIADEVVIAAIVSPESIGIIGYPKDISLYITTTIDAEHIGAKAELEDVTTPMSYIATPASISIDATFYAIPMFSRIDFIIRNIVPPVLEPWQPTPAAYALRRYYLPGPRGENVFIVNNAIVQTYQPADQSTVTRQILGGHDAPDDLTDTEVALLIAAGYPFSVGPQNALV